MCWEKCWAVEGTNATLNNTKCAWTELEPDPYAFNQGGKKDSMEVKSTLEGENVQIWLDCHKIQDDSKKKILYKGFLLHYE